MARVVFVDYIESWEEAVADVKGSISDRNLNPDDYDLEAITDEVYEVRHDGTYIPVGTPDEFWEIVHENKKQ